MIYDTPHYPLLVAQIRILNIPGSLLSLDPLNAPINVDAAGECGSVVLVSGHQRISTDIEYVVTVF